MAELIVSCPNCKAKYNVAKLESGTKFKCKSCGKFLIVPQKPELDLEEEPEEAVASAKGKTKSGGGRPSSKRAAAPAKGRRREEPEEGEEGEERVRPKLNRGPNYAILGVTGAVVLILLIVGIVTLMKLSAKNKADADRREQERAEAKAQKDKYSSGGLTEDGAKPAPPKDKYKKPDKSGVGAGEQVGKDGKIKEMEDDKEAQGEETERTAWKDADGKTKMELLKLRGALIAIDGSAEAKAKTSLNKIKNSGDDPAAEREGVDELDTQGKEAVAAALNFLTKEINWKSEDGIKSGSIIFEYVSRKARDLWGIENEFQVGAFESGSEIQNAITEMKKKVLEKEKSFKIKE